MCCPADERWVAVSADNYNDPDHSLRDELPAACRREGIGLLRVRSAERVTPLRGPGPRKRTEAVAGLLRAIRGHAYTALIATG